MIGRLPYECAKVREQLPGYAEGALIGRELARVERHAASCERCRKEVADLRVVIGAVRAVPPEEVPDTLIPRVRRAVQGGVPGPGARLLWPRLAIPIAILSGVIAVSFALRAPRQEFTRGGEVALARSAPQLASKATERGAAGGGAGGARAGARLREPTEPPPAEAATKPAEVARASAEPSSADKVRAAERPEAPQPAAEEFARASPAPAGPAFGGAAGGAPARDLMAPPPSLPRPPEAMRGGRGAYERSGRGAGGRGGYERGGPRSGARNRGEVAARPAPFGLYDDSWPYGARARLGQRRPGTKALGGARSAGGAGKAEAARPAFASARLIQGAEHKMVALEVASEGLAGSITVRLGSEPPQAYQWQGAGTRPATIPLRVDKLGPGPVSVPVEVTSSAGKHDYVLFLPTMARLGEVAPAAPVARYEGAPLRSVLAELSAMTGLVILAEQPLEAEVKGAIPRGTPEASLRQLGAASGFEVEGQGDFVFTLTRRR